jgi:hypothetical protein
MTTLYYLAVGAACHSDKMFLENNQQYPSFLETVAKSLGYSQIEIILIDPGLDKITVPNVEEICSLDDVRILSGSNGNQQITVYAYKKTWSWFFEREVVDADIAFFDDLVQKCLDGQNKMIVMDYTGRDIYPLFFNLIKEFDFDQVINNICIDPGHNQGCFPDLNKVSIKMNGRNFYQEQFLPLMHVSNYRDFIRDRINKLNYPISKVLSDLLYVSGNVQVIGTETMNRLALIYRQKTFAFRQLENHNVDTTSEDDIIYVSELIDWLFSLLRVILADICMVMKMTPLLDSKLSLLRTNKRTDFQRWTCDLLKGC